MITAIALLDQMSTAVPVDAPWSAANAAAHDGQTLAQFIQEHSVTERFRRLLPLYPRAVERLPVAGHDLVISSSSAFAFEPC